jgi:hypothetical protein
MAIFALSVSVVFAALMRDEPAEQIRFGGRLFAAFMGLALLAGWVLYMLPL